MAKLNRKLLEKVKRHILAVPERLEMSDYRLESTKSPCGTQACMAGWTVLLGRHVPLKKFNTYVPKEGWYTAARKLLGLTKREASRMFLDWNYNSGEIGAQEVASKIDYILTNRKGFSAHEFTN